MNENRNTSRGVGDVQEALYAVALEALGSVKRCSPDWFLESEGILMPLIEAKREATARWRHHPSPENRISMLSHRRIVKATVKGCKNDFLQKRAQKMQKLADENDLLQLYKEIRSIEGSTPVCTITPVLDRDGRQLLTDPHTFSRGKRDTQKTC